MWRMGVSMIPLSPFNPCFILLMCSHWPENLMETYFEALGSIQIFDVYLLYNLQISYICCFKFRLLVALSPSTTFFPWTDPFVPQSIIIPYENDITVINLHTKHKCIALHNHGCISILLKYNTLIFLIQILLIMKHMTIWITSVLFIIITYKLYGWKVWPSGGI